MILHILILKHNKFVFFGHSRSFIRILFIIMALNVVITVAAFFDFATKTYIIMRTLTTLYCSTYRFLTFLPVMIISSFTEVRTDLYKYSPDAVPPIHAVSYHVATDKPPPAKDGDKFRSIFSDNPQPIATRGKKARGTLLADQHCGNGCSIKRAPLSVSYYNEISGGHIWRGLYGGGVLPAQYCPCGITYQY